MKRLTNILLVLVVLFVFVGPIAIAKGDDLTLMEADETVNGFYALGNYGQINAKSPFRVGDSGSGSNDWVTITAVYNEPRYSSSSGYYHHTGVDLSAYLRNVYCVYGDIQNFNLVKIATYSSSYGNYVVIQHQVDSDNYYAFQSLYAHLNSISVAVNDRPLTSTKIGVSGTTGQSNGYHLHLQFPCATTNYSQGSRSYAPAVFYSYVGTWGNDTSFINRLPKLSSTTLRFRVAAKLGNGNYAYIRNVYLWYKESGETNWHSKQMKLRVGYQYEYIIDVRSDLGYNRPVTLLYYVSAETNAWDGTNYYTGYRPYRYKIVAPNDRPFSEFFYISSLKTYSSTPAIDSSSYCNSPYDADPDAEPNNSLKAPNPPIIQCDIMVDGGIIEKISDHMYLFTADDRKTYVLKFRDDWDTSGMDTRLSTDKTPLRIVLLANYTKKTMNGYKVLEVVNIKSLESDE